MSKRCVCPGCAAVYAVPAAQLLPGRMLRCFRCGDSWQEMAPAEQLADIATAPEPAAPEPPMPGPPVPDTAAGLRAERVVPAATRAPATAPRRPALTLALAWAVSVATVLGGGSVLVAGHRRVAQIWPASIRLYHAVGLAG